MSRSLNLAVIPGDGIGQEVVAQGLKVLSAVLPQDVKLETKEYDFGAKRYHATGETLTDADAGRRSRSTTPSCSARSATRACRPACWSAASCSSSASPSTTTSTCVRRSSCRASPPRSPASPEIDFVVVREGTEGPYTGNGGTIRKGTPHEVATEVSVNTAFGVERVVRDAFARAQARPRKKLTLVHKNNVLALRRSPVDEHLQQGGRGVPRGHHRLHARGRRDDLPRHAARALRRDRHRQPLRRHHHRPRRGRLRRHRRRRQREHQPDRRVPLDVRAGARLGARHRGHRARPTPPPPSCPSPSCCATSATRPRPPASRTPSPPTSRSAARTPARPTRSATRSPYE